jgi:outer membrane receptor protein involved in Fe transport
MVWLGHLTRLCALWLILVHWTYARAADDAPTMRAVAAAIPAQPLPQALAAFSVSARLQLVYVSQLALGKVSQAVPAGLPAAASLEHLLKDTGLDFLFLNERTVKLFERPRAAPASAPPPVSGRESAGSSSAAESLDEVVVSATKRKEILSTLPMSISVLSPEDMDASGMQGISGIAAVSTGIEYDFSSQYGPGILSNIAIRGIGSDKGDATTGIYVDDTPIQTPHTVFGNAYPVTFDLARVEVLRGPQGVLFGRGAEGGAIRYITNEPSTTTASQLYRSEVSTTEHGGTSVEFGAAAGGPLVTDVVGARVSAWYREDSGYVNRIDPFTGAVVDADANRSASKAVRASLAFEPNDSVRVTPSFSHQSMNLHDTPSFYANPPPQSGILDNGKLLRQPAVDDLTMESLTVADRMGPANLTAITSYVDRTATATVDTTNEAAVVYFNGFGNPLGPEFPSSYADAVPTLLTLHQIQLTQEIRLASPDSAAPIQWLGGIFYSRLRQDSTQDTYLIAAPANPAILTDDYNTITEGSAFGQTRWSLNPYWNLGAGVRMGWLGTRGSSHASGFINAGFAPYAQSNHQEMLPPTPRFDLSYQPDGRNLFYAAIANGLRAGGYAGPGQPCGSTVTPSSFGPDSVWSFEVGAKNQLFDRRLHLDTSVFDIHWNGIQERVQDSCGNNFTTNAGTARSSGFDLAADALMTDRFHLAVAVGYLDVRYTRTLKTPDGQLIVVRGAVVGGVPSVPAPWSGTVSARYEWPLTGVTAAYLRAEEITHSHNPGPFTELEAKNAPSYDPRLSADPATYLLNLQLGLTWSGVNVHFFVNNAMNTQPLLQRFADAPGSALLYAYSLRPRTIGITGNWSF